ncbi:MAG: hypothetical protein EXR99_13680, partial [Gemmataceae bacterium]|nr:hypothetical protein [Gemmataceae bacterium]
MADKNKPDNHDDDIIPFEPEGELEIPDPADGETPIQSSEGEIKPAPSPDEPDEFNLFQNPDEEDAPNEGPSGPSMNVDMDEEPEVIESEVLETPENSPPASKPKTMLARHDDDDALPDAMVDFSEGAELPEIISKKTRLASSQAKHTMLGAQEEMTQEEMPIESVAEEGTAPVDISAAPVEGSNEGFEVQEDGESVGTNEEGQSADLHDDFTPPEDYQPEPESEVAEEVSAASDEPELAVTTGGKTKGGGGNRFLWSMFGMILGAAVPVGLWEFGIELPPEYRLNPGPAIEELRAKKAAGEKDSSDKAKEIASLNKEKEEIEASNKVSLEAKALEKTKAVKAEQDKFDKAKLENEALVMVKEKETKDAMDAGVKAVAKADGEGVKNTNAAKTAGDKALADEKKAGALKLTEAGEKYAGLEKEKTKVEGELNTSKNYVASIGKELGKAELVKDSNDPKKVLEGLGKGMKIIQDKDPQGTMRRQMAEIEVKNKELTVSKQSGDLGSLPAPNSPNANTASTDQGKKVAGDLLKNPDASAKEKARATVFLGLDKLEKKDYAGAKSLLDKGKAGLEASDKEWLFKAEAGLKIASDPVGFYLAQVPGKTLAEKAKSLEMALEAARQNAPARVGEILAQRARVYLDLAITKGKGTVSLGDPNMQKAIQDADEAVKGSQASAFAAKMNVEKEMALAFMEMGQILNARKSKAAALDAARKAVAADKTLEFEALSVQSELNPISQAPANPSSELGLLESMTAWVVTGLYFQPINEEVLPKVSSQDLKKANDILKNPKTATMEQLIWAYTTKGLLTKAMGEMIQGFWVAVDQPLTVDKVKKLQNIFQNHPNLTNPDFEGPKTHEFAERCFADGINLFYTRNFPDAELALTRAIQAYPRDARYHYFLALARYSQGKIAAAEDFMQAANLERQGHPNRGVVSSALERVQGPVRNELNKYRNAAS